MTSLRAQPNQDLRHRIRPLRGRDPDERGRPAMPLGLLYDLTCVFAFGAAAEQLAHRAGHETVALRHTTQVVEKESGQ